MFRYSYLIAVSCALWILTACQSSLSPSGIQVPTHIKRFNVQPLAVIESSFEYSTDRTTLTARLKDERGEQTEYKTVRQPLEGNKVQAETTVYRNGQAIETHITIPTEAQLVLKVAANDGLADIYRDLRTRYRLAGLVTNS